ncbi:peptidase M14 [Paraneptunicella aestuarii]|uniref:M14 family zinc carboxypeptidase n=1 Tax=Paraneptunicella aestuarii TaxID=2831148 RepID=UPI001E49F5FC|nr:M14 family zinc carboxypeptidase [Paraneptunicella aestuarii]UAA38885.1 peptidase M14 [Paraneptunicella aestuarii]
MLNRKEPSSFWCLFALVAGLFCSPIYALDDADYLPKSVTYAPDIATPKSVLGSAVGEWHVRHDQLVQYMQLLASQSPRMQIKEIGRTHENRPMLHLYVSSPENLSRLESIREQHLQNWQQSKGQISKQMPAVVWMGFSIHGDEPSGANSSLLLAYYLAAAQGQEIDSLLQNTVIILEPSLNPDGLARFAQWANMHKGKNLVSDPNHREHLQGWPSARTNHYWFDLNRDWLLLTHPESQARIEEYHRWRPHVLTDYHEMGSNSTYFFQPGVPSRTNPWTPVENLRLTTEFAKFFANDFDKVKRSYFTEEGYDDFYYGKGSSYPDAHGSIGILFEQASSRGHVQDTINGQLTFPRTIENQLMMSLATLRGAQVLRPQLLEFQSKFNTDAAKLAQADELAGYLVTESADKARLNKMLDKLSAHQIHYYPVNKSLEVDDVQFTAEHSYFIPLEQPQYRLLKSLFSNRKRFNDNTFYDVSNWNIALAYNITYRGIERSRWRKVSYFEASSQKKKANASVVNENAVAHAFSWQDSNAPTLLQMLLNRGVKVRIAAAPFNAISQLGDSPMLPGSAVIQAGDKQPENYLNIVKELADELGIRIWSISTGLTTEGIDLGSRNVQLVEMPKVMILGGRGMSQYEAGELWHYFDQQLQLPVSIVEWSDLESISLEDYTHIFMVNGRYKQLSASATQKVGDWLQNGGTLIGQQNAAKWFSKQEWLATTFVDDEAIDNAFDVTGYSYADKDKLEANKLIAGAVYETETDMTHPLLFGFGEQAKKLPMFKSSNLIMRKPAKPFLTVASYSTNPLMAGYSADEMQKLVANSAAIVAHKKGNGRVIAILDRSNFRGYWQGTNRLLSNAIYMSQFIDVEAK